MNFTTSIDGSYGRYSYRTMSFEMAIDRLKEACFNDFQGIG